MKSLSSPGLLSVIIPNYNYGRFIAETIASVFRQDYGSIELVVVDDGSTDHSLEAIRDAIKRPNSLSRIEVVEMPTNSGKLAAMNAGLKYCVGEYVIVLDADDLLTDSYASRCIHELNEGRKEDPQLGFIYSNCQLVDENGADIGRGKSTAFDPSLIERFSFIPEPAVTLMAAVMEASPYDETIRKGTKHHKWRRIIENGWRGKHIAEPLFSYRMHGQNLSGIGSRVIDEIGGGHTGERLLSGYWPTQTR
ncbi:glycosyl transferase family 2 [Iodidimonas muriae]|uniref:Glycosyl transferase family 2 n=1 Tax=Iodidimonas muriae TaxID=261467 RepID=A0ABQ2LG42_9PROT|nr:glycosyltransferase [Iodidimonas muriae]GER08728.1 glycosyl transferase family 2 [Kordiimonadales bacterium JCM 17843]GGO16527.1 glycosyl transferase family 2 [Iodidimonas muriae]